MPTYRHVHMRECQMPKPQRKSLADALQAESTRAPKTSVPAAPDAAAPQGEMQRADAPPPPAPVSQSYVAPSRRGKKVVSGHFDTEVSKQLKLLCVEHDTSLQALLTEALNDLFTKYGKSPIA